VRQLVSILRHWRRDLRGATAVEFAFVLPVAAVMIIGTMSASQLVGVVNGMHFAVEEAARCSAVNETLCGSNVATQNFAAARFAGPGPTPTFVASGAGCGHTVTGTTTYELNIAFSTIAVPLSATSCFPGVDPVPA
jgi:Flp pilus assembly protein TadG